MTIAAAPPPSRARAVRVWLLLVAGLIGVMVLVGGATRLTESGLSIVEWKPVTGTLPPLSEAQWRAAFDGYKQIPQYRELNAGMTLDQFKTIFWWEWSHRLLGRVIGIVYLLPFLWFLWRGAIGPRWTRALWIVFGLGALQGAVGWWMVASGLSQRTEVSQVRLAIHLTLALIIYAAIVWTVCRMTDRVRVAAPLRLKATALVLLGLTFVQLFAGALVAGLRAGRLYNTWPEIDGALIPDAARLWFETPWWRNLFDNHLTVQFDHRMLAYALWTLAALHMIDALRTRAGAAARGAVLLFLALTAQAVLGILTVLYAAPIDLALAHQAMALVVLTLTVLQAERLTATRVDRTALDRGRATQLAVPSKPFPSA
ncbi:heme A synthase [Rhodopseudomonas palustris]|uniref:COX15/CtaA family protein n=1 Tax=Rhodopseudomonas palustris TaxID=1076 RepID=UPI00115F58FA|nr:COX15/CtaA family protein [Rhodopseudomonas palustris]QDL97463.1 heme A synthase [Rhodopseudomonas palustris]